MKHIPSYFRYTFFLTLLLLLNSESASAQNLPVQNAVPVAATPVQMPGAYSTPAGNYYKLWSASIPVKDTAYVKSVSRPVKEVKLNTQYYDGLGRMIQTVIRKGSSSGKDIVIPVVYDEFGKEKYKYLPYSAQTGVNTDGSFKVSPFTEQSTFYKSLTLNPGVSGESIYYSETETESSPLGRVLKVYEPGNNWAKAGGNHPASNQYLMNTLEEGVRVWDGNSIIPVSTGVYPAGQLSKVVSVNEHGSRTIVYKDAEDQVVLKKEQIGDLPGISHDGWLCTYYVYDDMGNLLFVIPPKAVEAIASNWVITNTVAAELCFIYRYDNRARVIVSKVPGTDSTEMVYDTRDRLVFSRDASLKAQDNWKTTFYDGLNRPVMTALYKAPGVSRSSLQSTLSEASPGSQNISYTFPGAADLVIGSYNNETLIQATNSIMLENGFETNSTELMVEINAGVNNGTTAITVNNPLPGIPIAALTPMTYSFYDDYNYDLKLNYNPGDINLVKAGSNPYVEALPAQESKLTRGLITGTKIRVIGTNQWLTTSLYYNDIGKAIQSISENINGGKTTETYLYDFSGKLLSSYQRHTNPRSGVTPQTTLLTMYHYDDAERMDSVKKMVNDRDTLLRTLAVNIYSELGLQKNK